VRCAGGGVSRSERLHFTSSSCNPSHFRGPSPLVRALGPHEITAPLGAGDMGEVYRATDTNLRRQVATKVLPESLSPDADRLARFH